MKKKHTLSLTLIVRNEEKHIPRVLENAHIFADEIIIIDTGSEDNTVEEAKKFTDKVFNFEWCEDFAKARNFGIEKCTKDFVMWLDADDIVPIEDAKNMKKLLSKKIEWDALYLPYHISQDEKGNTTCFLKRERIFRNDGRVFFQYPVHECLKWPESPFTTECSSAVNIYHKNIHRWQSSAERNFTILEKSIKSDEYKGNPRIWEMYAFEAPAKKAIPYYKKLIAQKETTNDKRSEFCFEIAKKFLEIKEEEDAIKFLGQAITLYPLWREPFFELGKIYWQQEKYKESLQMFLLCQKIKRDASIFSRNPSLYNGSEYYDWLSLSYDRNGEYRKALFCTRKCLSFVPNDERYKKNEEYYLEKLKIADL